MGKKAVLWDLDGTILDSISVMHAILTEIFPKFDLPIPSREEVRKELYGSLEGALVRYSNNYADQAALMEAFIQAQHAHYIDPVMFEAVTKVIFELSNNSDVAQAIVTSRNSNGGRGVGALEIVKTTGLDKYMGTVISAEESEKHKPHPEPLLMALDIIGVKPSDAVMVGDQPVDAIAAHAAGTKSILIDHEGDDIGLDQLRSANPDVIVQNPDDLLPYIIKALQLK